MKKYIYPLAITATLLATAACSDDEVNAVDQPIPDSQKEMISFSLSDGAASTRAGFTGSATSIAMRIQSDEKGSSPVNTKYTRTVASASKDATNNSSSYSEVTFTDSNVRYWDDAFGRKALLSVYAVAIPNGASDLKNNGQTLEALLAKGDESAAWGTNTINTIAWQVTTSEQSKDASDATAPAKTIDLEDLVYSNNIQADATLGKDGVYRWDYSSNAHKPDATGSEGTHKDGRMLFYQQAMTDANAATTPSTADPGHFDKGHLKFKHALSRMTITLVAGEGFASKPFAFADGTNIKLLSMNYSGTLDIKAGSWSSVQTKDIDKIAKTTSETTAAGTYVAQMLPGYVFGKTSDDNVMTFTIDDNVYYITQKMLFEALTYDANGNGTKDEGDGDLFDKKNETGITMEQGANYKFKITVNKTGISAITATLVDWVDVKGSTSVNNSHLITVATLLNDNTGAKDCNDLVLYRLAQTFDAPITTSSYTATDYRGDYKVAGNRVVPTENGTNSNNKKWKTTWFFENNKTAYHIRSINTVADKTSEAGDNVKNPTSGSIYSYFTMVNGTQDSHDYHWGAPMNTTSTNKFIYDVTDGYKSHLYQGIVSTEAVINITELHMMSNINIVLKTTSDGSAVDLRTGDGSETKPYAYATVELTDLYATAQVDMGIGLVTPTGSLAPTNSMDAPNSTSVATANQKTYFVQTTGDTPTDDITTTNPFTWAAVPQLLTNTIGSDTKKIGVTITTPDGNKYFAVLDGIVATANGSSQNQEVAAINRWYPGHSYTYTFTLTKTGIEAITCTLADWVNVTAGNTNLDLEK